ncbi:hypothetical protein KBC89_03960 [Candidatus Woesebacteria bacterium]|nr:hypothetical protein [Candidatus Woesebacteria bacterium]
MNLELLTKDPEELALRVLRLREELEELEYEIDQKQDFPFGLPALVYVDLAKKIETTCIQLMNQLELQIAVLVSEFDHPSNRDVLIEEVVEGLVIVPSNQEATQLYKELNDLLGRAKKIRTPSSE